MNATAAVPDPRRWKALVLLCAAFFMVVLDVAIVNVALPSIGQDLDFSQDNLQWVITAYSLTFGGFLLLGGRAADLLGRRVVFMTGVAIFTIASLLCGLAQSEAWLIAARAVQGFGAALLTPAALSIITTTFTERAERNKALGVWGAVGGSGAAAGVLMGGVLTKLLGWEWIFFVNVPVGIAAFLLVRSLVDESRADLEERSFDIPGAVLVTSGLALFVYAISRAPIVGWGTARTIGLIVLSIALVAGFVFWESRAPAPLMPLDFIRDRLTAAANATSFLLAGSMYANFFVLTLYMQQVLNYSALQAGLAFLATAGTAVVVAGPSQALVTRIGVKPVLVTGLTLLLLASLWYTRLPVDGTYPTDLLIPYVVYGAAIALSFIPVTIAALAGAPEHEAGLASGMINTSQQIGGAIGLAVVATVANSHTEDLLEQGKSVPTALTDGFQRGYIVIALIAAAALLVAVVFIHRDEVQVPEAEPVVEGAPGG
jgi:EmrB/QacA subfamily drug resistance transporter